MLVMMVFFGEAGSVEFHPLKYLAQCSIIETLLAPYESFIRYDLGGNRFGAWRMNKGLEQTWRAG